MGWLAGSAKILQESRERYGRRIRRYHAVMIARHRKDGSRIIAERIVELVVIILGFAEAGDDVPQMIEKRWNMGGIDIIVLADNLISLNSISCGPVLLPGSPIQLKYDFTL